MNSAFTTSSDEKTLTGVMYILCMIPVVNFIGPLIIWLVKRDQSSFIDEHGKEIINFQILMFLGGIVSSILTVILIGGVLALGLFIANIALSIMGALKAFAGEKYSYPFNLKILR